MSNLVTSDSLPFFLQFVAPGFIILYFRSIFLTGRMPPLAESIAASAILSVLYQAAILPITGLFDPKDPFPVGVWIAMVFLAPALIGCFLGFVAWKGWIRSLLRRMKLNPVHTIGTAWDWRCGRTEAGFVIVKMSDGEIVRGYMAENSFLSSDPKERDIYIELVYEKDKKGGDWIKQDSGIWLSGSHIKSIEFIPDDRGPEIDKE